VNQEQLQALEDAYLQQLNTSLQQGKTLAAVGDWDWPAYGVKAVSAVVVGVRVRDATANIIEAVYLVTVGSEHPIPNAGKTMREGTGGNAYTFVQLAASVGSGSYETQLLSTYVGTSPYPVSGSPAPRARSAAQPLGGGGGTPPHPPP
jgi:hypothetical protein